MFENLKSRLRKKKDNGETQPDPNKTLVENVTEHETPEMLEERKKKEEEFRKKRNPFSN